MGPAARLIPRQDLRTVASGLVIVLGLLLFVAGMRLAGGLAGRWLQLQDHRWRPRPLP